MKKLFMGFVTAALLMVCLCVPAFAADSVSLCDHWNGFLAGGSSVGLCVYYDDAEHYFGCSECGTVLSAFAFGDPAPHTGNDCVPCQSFLSLGLPVEVLSFDSPGFLPSITTLVTASIDWLTAFALCILSTPLFLIFVCCIFVGLGIGLIKRSIHL